MFSSPHGDFSFSMVFTSRNDPGTESVFVPSRGFLFFYKCIGDYEADTMQEFSSPHGDFSFSIKRESHTIKRTLCFRPLTGISLFLYRSFDTLSCSPYTVFVPSRGFLFFYRYERINRKSFLGFRPLTGISLFL